MGDDLLLKEYSEVFTRALTISTNDHNIKEPSQIKPRGELEKFLLDYELECRRSEELDDEIKTTKQALLDTKKYLKDTLNWKPSGRNQHILENLEKKLNNIKIQYGKLRKENELKRDQIQIIRRNASGAQRELSSLSKNLEKYQKVATDLQSSSENNSKIARAQKERIEKLNSSFTSNREVLNEKVSEFMESYRKEATSLTPTTVRRPRTPYSELAENIKALKFISNKWSTKVKEKESEISVYKENILELDETLRFMMNIINTSDANVAVKAFIDICEQEKDLSSNFLRLSEKIDTLERNIQKTQELLQKANESSHNKLTKKKSFLSKAEKELAGIEQKIAKHMRIKEGNEKSIESVYANVIQMMRAIEGLGIKANSFKMIEDPSLNSTNVISHLNKLEELIDYLLLDLKLRKVTYSKREEKVEKKIIQNLPNIEDLSVEETNFTMGVEEIRMHAKKLLENNTV